jgi:hypothetical protein
MIIFWIPDFGFKKTEENNEQSLGFGLILVECFAWNVDCEIYRANKMISNIISLKDL